MTQIIDTLAEVSDSYDALFVDLWGCVHNGVTALPGAVSALQAYRQRGGKVVLVTNAPRPWEGVQKQLGHFNVATDCWDAIATSGDSARSAMFQGAVGEKVWFIGQPHDQNFFEPLELLDNPVPIAKALLQDADGIVCTGPINPMADPAVMRPEFEMAIERGLKLLCANPDIVVDRGEVREWCAGALAQLYTEMGGTSLYFGKPHGPIYDLARKRLAALGTDVPDNRILCIGDGVLTDIKGAMDEGLDSLFITGGLAAGETMDGSTVNNEKLTSYLQKEKSDPTYSIGLLR